MGKQGDSSEPSPKDFAAGEASLQQFDKIHIKTLAYPWKYVDDQKPTELEYELFCGALESFWSKDLVELVTVNCSDDWTIALETVLPTLRSSIRMYCESCEEKAPELDVELTRWVKFGLSSSQSALYSENSRLVMIGCSLVKHLTLMHDRQLSAAFSEPCYLRYFMDIILSEQYCASVRCEAAQALLHILFHPSTSFECMLVKIDGYTPYEQIVRLFLKPEVCSVIFDFYMSGKRAAYLPFFMAFPS
ncbi:unnamed protein product [Gongylonema pulchrum]|uniref:Uncharacterized protein n=1 Tax=Gongylonema pulchrum TaxID=637853 RepID=A0A183CVA7_9BILA|nr:unnamed protein product [Gongylonema pulchrum]